MKMSGRYKRVKEENYDAYLSALGANFVIRKAMTASTPQIDIIEISTGTWKLVWTTTLKSVELQFEIGKAFEEVTNYGVRCTMLFTLEGEDTLIQDLKPLDSREKETRVIRVFSDKGMDAEFICGNVVSKQFFERV